MTRPSDLPLRYKVGMVAAFVAGVAGLWWIAHQLFHVWLPVELVRYLAVAMISFAGGAVLSYRLTCRYFGIRPNSDFQG